MEWDTPEGFLKVGGIVLVLVGLLGFFLTGPTAADSVLGSAWWFDSYENWAHLVLGVVALVLAFGVKHDGLNKWVTALVGLFALVVAVWGFFDSNFLGAGLENPLDNILHIVVGVWALYAAFGQNA